MPQSAAFDMTTGQRREERDNFEPSGYSRRARASSSSSMSSSDVRSFYRSTSSKLSSHIEARSGSKRVREWGRQRDRVRSCSKSAWDLCLQCGEHWTRDRRLWIVHKNRFGVGLSAIYMPYLTASESINTRFFLLLTENEWCCKPTFTIHFFHK